MSHDDLIADLTSLHFRGSRVPDAPYHALLAVVLLHKPEGLVSDPKCYECQGLDAVDYPCETIQTITKELA